MAAVFTSNHCDLQSWQYLSFIIEQIVHDHVIKADIVPRAGWLFVLFVGRVFLSVLDILFVFLPVCKKHGSTLLLKKAVWIAFGFIRCLEYITKAVRLSGQQEIFFGQGARLQITAAARKGQ